MNAKKKPSAKPKSKRNELRQCLNIMRNITKVLELARDDCSERHVVFSRRSVIRYRGYYCLESEIYRGISKLFEIDKDFSQMLDPDYSLRTVGDLFYINHVISLFAASLDI